MTGDSRLGAAVAGLKILIAVLDTGVSERLVLTVGEGDELDVPAVLSAAQRLSDGGGFILEELISDVGPDVILSLHAYKIAVGRLLKSGGFYRKQVRREGSRPLVWYRPQE